MYSITVSMPFVIINVNFRKFMIYNVINFIKKIKNACINSVIGLK